MGIAICTTYAMMLCAGLFGAGEPKRRVCHRTTRIGRDGTRANDFWPLTRAAVTIINPTFCQKKKNRILSYRLAFCALLIHDVNNI